MCGEWANQVFQCQAGIRNVNAVQLHERPPSSQVGLAGSEHYQGGSAIEQKEIMNSDRALSLCQSRQWSCGLRMLGKRGQTTTMRRSDYK